MLRTPIRLAAVGVAAALALTGCAASGGGGDSGGQVDVTAKGGTFCSRAADGLDNGQDAVLAIRPDDVKVGGDGQNRLRGKVELVEYLGREIEAAVMTEGQGRVWLRTPEKVALGDTIDLSFPADKLVLLRKE